MTINQAICTIIAKNYISYARTLCQSFVAHHPNGKFYVLIVDEWENYIDPAQESFEIISVRELGIPHLKSFCFKYDVVELSTAVKPFLLEYLLGSKSLDSLLYLDPDILITNSLSNLFSDLSHHEILVTPHLDTDYPEDGAMPDDGWIMKAGVFNLGFIGIALSENTQAFLNWWKGKLYNKCVVSPHQGYFVDQKFIDLAITLFDFIYIERNVGYNVAYWNLHSRCITREGNSWKCNGQPLHFFHFSGYRVEEPDQICRWITRYNLSNRLDLKDLFAEYREKLLENGYAQTRSWPYSYATFNTGEVIPYTIRSHFRWSLNNRNPLDNPFASSALKRKAVKIQLRKQRRYLLTFVNHKARQVLRPLYRVLLILQKRHHGFKHPK